METQELFGIKLFDFEEVQRWDTGLQYIDVTFYLEELKQYNGTAIDIDQEWNIHVWTINGEKVAQFNIIDVEEFKVLLAKKISDKDS